MGTSSVFPGGQAQGLLPLRHGLPSRVGNAAEVGTFEFHSELAQLERATTTAVCGELDDRPLLRAVVENID